MRATVLLVALFAFAMAGAPTRLAGQAPAENALYLELLGSGGVYSLNYERRVGDARLRVGFSNWTVDDLFGGGKDSYTVLPLTVSHVAGSGNHHLESGGGLTLGHTEFTSSFGGGKTSAGFVSLTGILGYRYQKPESGFIFRAVLTPFYGFGGEQVAYPDRGFFPSFGLSFGSAF